MSELQQLFDDIRHIEVPPIEAFDELARQAQAGHAEARRRCMLASLRIVVRLVTREFFWFHPQRQLDAIGEGHLGAVRALRTWVPGKSPFQIYALFWIRKYVRRFYYSDRIIRVPPEQPRCVPSVRSFSEPLRRSRESLGDTIPGGMQGPATEAEREDELCRLREALRSLPPHYAEILLKRAAGYSQKEIAAERGVRRQAIDQMEQKAMKRIRERLGAHGVEGSIDDYSDGVPLASKLEKQRERGRRYYQRQREKQARVA